MYPINHICLSVANLETSITFYENIFGARLLLKGRTTCYFDLNGVWLALNVQNDIPRDEIRHSYTHIAFTVPKEEMKTLEEKLKALKVNILNGRERHERDAHSLYFEDPDGHKFEFHSGTLQERLDYYRDEKPHMKFY
ncbi:metallothiol transferase FosB [Neobacillus sp. PS3-34]|uniref:metallothiol transferase FosB n=1 Tax=Neobacillus sp. PS3-34 TaxID=3070678 RepID=UPI0027E14881|nr:metallothiol transferase FosB [Neobacillus sp. PS3-34]WML49446.1 metallothiol transferase FosB [Neobacillus sp. PS3-34]